MFEPSLNPAVTVGLLVVESDDNGVTDDVVDDDGVE